MYRINKNILIYLIDFKGMKVSLKRLYSANYNKLVRSKKAH